MHGDSNALTLPINRHRRSRERPLARKGALHTTDLKQARSTLPNRGQRTLTMNMHVSAPSNDCAGDTPAKAWLRALEMTAPIAADPTRTLPVMLDALAELHGDAPA